MEPRQSARRVGMVVWLALAVLVPALAAPGLGASAGPIVAASTPPGHPQFSASNDWPTYLGSVERTSDAVGETLLSTANAANLSLLWNDTTGGGVVDSPAVVGGTVYIGSRDGYEYALNESKGTVLWKTFLGTTVLGTKVVGISDAATVQSGTLYVGGGNSSWYAVRTSNGAILWKVFIGNTSQGYYNWASPLISGGFAYVGRASAGDNPLVLGGIDEVSLTSHSVVHSFNTTAPGTLGASIWTSPALNPVTQTVYVTTGNPGPNGSTWGNSLLALSAGKLVLKAHWKLSTALNDSDFGATPVVFHPTPGATWIAASNKNGHFYVWNATHLGTGPVWNRTISQASTDVGTPNLGPLAWDGARLYVGSSSTSIGGKSYNGSIRVYTPLKGILQWDKGLPGPVLGAPLVAHGLLIVGAGNDLFVFNASNGKQLFEFVSPGKFLGAPVVSRGEIVAGVSTGAVYAFGLKGTGGSGLSPASVGLPTGGPSASPVARRPLLLVPSGGRVAPVR